jgi:hypothetical protein
MILTYEKATAWLDAYFEDVKRYQGALETVPYLLKYFTADLEFWMYTGRPSMRRPLSRDELLILFVHPGLHEALTPHYYAIDVTKMISIVQFEIRFVDQIAGKVWPTKQASAHYHLTFGDEETLKIKKIQYWTESHPPEVFSDMYDFWAAYREKALVELATNYMNGRP